MPRLRALSLALALPFLVTASVFAQEAYRVRDFALTSPPSAPASSSPGDFFNTDGALFFLASTPSTARAVWATDGTSVGTELLNYSCLYGCDTDPQFLGYFGRVAFWQEVPSNPYLPVEIWRSDGTRAGTFELLSNDAFDSLSTPSGLVFYTCGSQGCGFWLSDGTVAGTRPLLTFLPLPTSPIPIYEATLTGHRLVFGAGTDPAASPGAKLWVSDGTSAGSFLFATLPAYPLSFAGAGGHVFFVLPGSGGQGDQLWASDGTKGGLRQVSAFTTAHPFGFASTTSLVPLGDRVYFVPDDGTSKNELWTSDGTPAGTVRVSQLDSAQALLTPGSLAALGSRLLFLAEDSGGVHLYRTDGTPASTAALPVPPASGPNQGSLLGLSGRVLFTTGDAAHGTELWSTDGTDAGTFPLDIPCPGPCSGLPDHLQAFGNGALFNATDAAGQRTLWFTDGTRAGTHQFASVALAAAAGETGEIGALDGRAFFPAMDSHGVELWTSDGKAGGTALLADLAVEPPVAGLSELTAVSNRLFFAVFAATGTAPWQTDGTAAGTVPVPTPSPVDCPLYNGSPRLAAAGGGLFFVCQETGDGLFHIGRTDGSGVTGAGTVLLPAPTSTAAPSIAALGGNLVLLMDAELWKSDGTAAGTAQIADLPGGLSYTNLFTASGPEVYFEISADGGDELWRSDGTAAGTRRLLTADCLFFEQQNPVLSRVGSQVYLFTRDCDETDQLWVTDGTAAGTRAVTTFEPSPFGEGLNAGQALAFNGRLFFTGFTPDAAFSLFQSDGTAAGTGVFYRFFGINNLTVFAGRLFFGAVGDVSHGYELWSTDGTPSGTALFSDIFPGPDSSYPSGLTVAGDRLFFIADDGVHGFELWETDGTPASAANPAGTHLVQDLAPEGLSSRPDQLTVAGDRLYFTADDGLSGRSLWALPLSGPAGCQPGDTRLCLSGGRFQVEIAWTDFQGNTGVGHAVSLTADTGYFWFFDPTNTEVIVKVLDARTLNDAFWVFYGALSNVEYTMTVTDTTTGLTRRYQNPAGNLASVGDTAGFGPLGAFAATTLAAPAAAPAWVSARTDATAAATVCVPGPKRLCLQGDRFAVTATWKDFQGNTGTGTAVPLSGDTGYFWFFAPTNVEVVTKVLDGRALGGKFWFFYGALSDVEYTLTVTDTQTGAVKTYKNPSGQFGSVADTAAF
jgi:ELWxxDGT repeat protein